VFALLAYVYVTLPDVRALARTNPSDTAFMQLRREEARAAGRSVRQVHRWVPYSRISNNLKRAVLVAEDDAFFQHEGVDFAQIRETLGSDLTSGRTIRGASTITQQLAKNLYLSPSRDPLRKLREWIIARRLETALPKVRIFEIYLNVIEWGDDVWGAEAAARKYFGTSAASLTPVQAALLAGAIVNPRVLRVNRPSRRLLNRQRIILTRMRVAPPTVQPTARAEGPVQVPPAPAVAPVPDAERGPAPDDVLEREVLEDDTADEARDAESTPAPEG
jgi:monofunctional biosynthetic peptidoglycan transglycosylase